MRLTSRPGRRPNKSSKWLNITIALAVTLAIGLMGTTVAMWSDSIKALEQINTGKLEAIFNNVIGFDHPCHAGMTAQINKIDGKDYHQLYLTIVGAWHHDDFSCTFEIKNTGTVPIKLGQPQITHMDQYWWKFRWRDAMSVDYDLPDSIDPGKTATGVIRIHNNSPWFFRTYRFESFVPCYQWNQVSERYWEDTLHIDGQLTVVTE